MIHDNILGTIGRTPIVRIQRLAPRHAAMFVKCEFFNPLASVKDRLAIAVFENEANPAYHRSTTGPEILSDFAGKRLDYFVTGWGTGGTLTGAGQMIRLARPDVQIIATEPAGAALLSGEPFTPHKIQGWTPDFVPAVLDRTVPHRVLPVTESEAIETARALARSEGVFCGISSGGTFAAALKVADEAPEGSVILAMLPDTGERYLSTALFEGIAEGSDPEP